MMFVFVIVGMTGMRMIMSMNMRVCVRCTGVPSDTTSVKYVRKSSKGYMVHLGPCLPSGECDDYDATKMQSYGMVTSEGCWKREEDERRR